MFQITQFSVGSDPFFIRMEHINIMNHIHMEHGIAFWMIECRSRDEGDTQFWHVPVWIQPWLRSRVSLVGKCLKLLAYAYAM